MARQPRQFSGEFKFNIVLQLLTGARAITELCRGTS